MKLIILPQEETLRVDLREVIAYRELLATFVWRDIKVRYKQTILGVAWAIFQPFTSMVIFSIFFGGFAKIPSDGIPYPIFVFSGLIFWNYFSIALTSCSNVLIENENIIKKIYFPRIILPLASVSTPVIDFFVSWIILMSMMIYFNFSAPITVVFLIPILLFLTILTTLGIGTLLAAVNARFRDVRYILPFFIQLVLFLTPVIYPVTIVPDSLRWLLFINPMTAVIETARASLFQEMFPNIFNIMISVFSSLCFLLSGLIHFKRTEMYFADLL